MKLLILMAIGLATTLSLNAQFLEEFESGFKYALDHENEYAGMSKSEFMTAIKKHFDLPSSFTIKTLSEVLNEGNHPWSNDLTNLLSYLDDGISNAKTFEEFLKSLTIFQNNASRLVETERNRTIDYAELLRAVLLLLYEDLQYYNQCCDATSSIPMFWPELGKCAAGIIGGAGTGALGGAAIGAGAAGFGAPLGAIIGGLAGAFTGAASFCK